MSAAEKLKALEAAAAGLTKVTLEEQIRAGAEAGVALFSALPQIVAVVEAAEKHAGHFHAGEPFTGVPLHADLAAALAALDEALT